MVHTCSANVATNVWLPIDLNPFSIGGSFEKQAGRLSAAVEPYQQLPVRAELCIVCTRPSRAYLSSGGFHSRKMMAKMLCPSLLRRDEEGLSGN